MIKYCKEGNITVNQIVRNYQEPKHNHNYNN